MKKYIIFIIIFTLILSTSVWGAYTGYTTATTDFYSGPSTYASILCTLPPNTSVIVRGWCGGGNSWCEIMYNNRIGYVNANYITFEINAQTEVSTQEAEPAPVTTPAPQNATTNIPISTPAPTSTPIVQNKIDVTQETSNITETAQKYLNINYKWAGTSPSTGFDCSGYVQYVYAECGYTIKRVAQEQADTAGVEVKEAQPGDILCFGNSERNIWHVGIYLGDNQFIHSSASNGAVCIDDLTQYNLRLIKIKRIIEEN